ncbi:MAG: CHRD domain-containing protein [Acidimicrobiia bacterium]
MGLAWKHAAAGAAFLMAVGASSAAGARIGFSTANRPDLRAAATDTEEDFVATVDGASVQSANASFGRVYITVDQNTGRVCANVTMSGIDAIAAVTIEQGSTNQPSSGTVANFDISGGTAGSNCTTVSTGIATAVVAAPGDYFAFVTSNDHPDGAARGQLGARENEIKLLSSPQRAYDSRTTAEGRFASNETRTIDLHGAGVPISVQAALVNLTVTETDGAGYLVLYSNEVLSIPGTSSINWSTSNQNVANTSTVAVDGQGRVRVTAGPASTHVIIDVIGYVI